MITPPVAIGAYAAAHLAGADPIKTGFEAVRFGWLVFLVPFLFVFSGTLLMHGSPAMIAIDFVAAVVGVGFGAAGVMGYSVRHLAMADRVVYLVAGLFLLLPIGAFGVGRWVNLVGLALAVAIVVREKLLRRNVIANAQPR